MDLFPLNVPRRSSRPREAKRSWVALTLLALLAACVGHSLSTPITPAPGLRGVPSVALQSDSVAPVALAHASCVLSFARGESDIACRSEAPHDHRIRTGSASPFGAYVFVTMTHLKRDSTAHTWALDASVRNLLKEPLGTLDGNRALGVYTVIPNIRVTGGTGGANVANADGDSTLIGARQPYFRSARILGPDQASSAKTWRFNVPNTANSVTLEIVIAATFPAELNVRATPPDSEPQWFRDDSSWAGPTHRGELKGVVSLCFTDNATAQERQLAVAYAGGTIIGGEPVDGGDGCYYMRAPNDGSLDPVGTAIDRLESLPQVAVAAPTDQASPGATRPAPRPSRKRRLE